MASKKHWMDGALYLFAQMARDRMAYRCRILKKDIPVLPGVFSPKYFPDAIWFAKELPNIVGERSFLEIGTGTGIASLFVALNGSRNVVATDINPEAVKNARQTFMEYDLLIPVYCGDVYEPIGPDEKFDVIFWNHPFHYADKKPKSLLLRAGFDYQYKDLRSFFSGARGHLRPGGQVLLGTGNMACIDEIKRIARENNFSWKLLKKIELPPQKGSKTRRDNRIYSFKPIEYK